MYQAKHQKISKSNLKLKKVTLTGVALVSTGILGTALATAASADTANNSNTAEAAAKPTVKTPDQINQEAMIVIHGDLGNGGERVDNLTKAGFDPQAVQDKVNQYYNQLGYSGAYQASTKVVEAQTNQQASTQQTALAAAQQETPATVSSSDVVGYAANKMAANTGVSASQWTAIIMRESGGNPNAVNSSSGAYGLFQLLGHGEYSGMSVDAQIAMATQVYQSQGAGAWAQTW